jgi:hypothetical protein
MSHEALAMCGAAVAVAKDPADEPTVPISAGRKAPRMTHAGARRSCSRTDSGEAAKSSAGEAPKASGASSSACRLTAA